MAVASPCCGARGHFLRSLWKAARPRGRPNTMSACEKGLSASTPNVTAGSVAMSYVGHKSDSLFLRGGVEQRVGRQAAAVAAEWMLRVAERRRALLGWTPLGPPADWGLPFGALINVTPRALCCKGRLRSIFFKFFFLNLSVDKDNVSCTIISRTMAKQRNCNVPSYVHLRCYFFRVLEYALRRVRALT